MEVIYDVSDQIDAGITDVGEFFGKHLGKKDKAISAKETGFNQIDRLPVAREAFIKNILPFMKPEQRAEALRVFESYYTGNFNLATGKVTLYRFVDFTPEYPMEKIIANGIQPRAVATYGSMDKAVEALLKSGSKDDQVLARAYQDQQAGKDISKFIETYNSAGEQPSDIATYWTPHETSVFSGFNQYRITIELSPTEAWRQGRPQAIMRHLSAMARRYKDPYYQHNLYGENPIFDAWTGRSPVSEEMEWTILGEVSPDRIQEITDLSTSEKVYAK